MSLIQETRSILRAYGISPRKGLGQNFVVDAGLLDRMISYAQIRGDEVVLEIGAGLGFLTELLAERCREVIAVELDPKLTMILRDRLSAFENITVLQGDILKLSVPPFSKVVSSPPYSISSPVIHWLVERNSECGVLIFQKEFADRLVAESGSKDYGSLTVFTYYRAEVDLLEPVPRRAFWPQPSVDSVIVRLKPKKPPFQLKDESVFYELVRTLFTQRNRKIRNAIKPFLKKRGLSDGEIKDWSEIIPFVNRRTRELTPEDFGVIANEVADRMREKDLL
ncbi:MAG: 16S rRNA (adenine(1518)-N(6)/adenine(1519)-N(6))-dimethyltransferase RsmA [Candidatus Bathyarchaeota archaeon]|nr:16S rRNA (adenine(1518)-N(6)/adenine(1519)-N(6))-dimethyltransferase RsmA [Candidatus Bathyarchaeota archaeon]